MNIKSIKRVLKRVVKKWGVLVTARLSIESRSMEPVYHVQGLCYGGQRLIAKEVTIRSV